MRLRPDCKDSQLVSGTAPPARHLLITQNMEEHFQLSAYDYHLPEETIAQRPAASRDQSKLLVLDCDNDRTEHRQFADIIDYFLPGDLLVLNNTKVFPARLLGRKESGGKVEILFLSFPEIILAQQRDDGWFTVAAEVLLKSSKRPREGSRLIFGGSLRPPCWNCSITDRCGLELLYGRRTAKPWRTSLSGTARSRCRPILNVPAGSTDEDADGIRPKYAEKTGSVAAPTAGLHFSENLLRQIRQRGVVIVNVTLHVGYGTFAPVRAEDIRDHRIHSEYIQIPPETAETINEYKKYGSRVWAVGTTTARALEFTAYPNGAITPFSGTLRHVYLPGLPVPGR